MYNEADRVSVYSESAPIIMLSEPEFDFNDASIHSVAYRRVRAAAKYRVANLRQHEAHKRLTQGNEKITTDTHCDHSGEKDDRNHKRQKNQIQSTQKTMFSNYGTTGATKISLKAMRASLSVLIAALSARTRAAMNKSRRA